MAAARAATGDPVAFERAWAVGQGVSLEQAIECAVGDSDSDLVSKRSALEPIASVVYCFGPTVGPSPTTKNPAGSAP